MARLVVLLERTVPGEMLPGAERDMNAIAATHEFTPDQLQRTGFPGVTVRNAGRALLETITKGMEP